MTMHANIGGTYKTVIGNFCKVGGVWKTVVSMWSKISNVWKLVWAADPRKIWEQSPSYVYGSWQVFPNADDTYVWDSYYAARSPDDCEVRRLEPTTGASLGIKTSIDDPDNDLFEIGGIYSDGDAMIIVEHSTDTSSASYMKRVSSADGTIDWSYSFGGSGVSNPVLNPQLDSNGYGYCWVTDAGKLFKISSTGGLSWSKTTAMSKFAVNSDGSIIMLASANDLYRWDSTGTLAATYTDIITGTIAGLRFGPDGKLYIWSGTSVYRINASTGTVEATFDLSSNITGISTIKFATDFFVVQEGGYIFSKFDYNGMFYYKLTFASDCAYKFELSLAGQAYFADDWHSGSSVSYYSRYDFTN